MALTDGFEGIRGTILHCSPLPSVDSVVNELLAEELRLKVAPGKGLLPLPCYTVLAAPISSQINRPPTRMPFDECSFCHQRGHWKSQCPKL